jgi:hypothetical protein
MTASQVPEPVDIIPRARRELWIPTEVLIRGQKTIFEEREREWHAEFQHETKVQSFDLCSQE